MTENEIRDLFKTHSVPLDRDDVWKVQQAIVVKHKALERLAGGLRIQWDAPQIIRAERDEAVILAAGRLPEGPSEWSIGECLQTDGTAPGNYRVSGRQAPYVYAMAEKRAKDRVILKLAGLFGAYSEDEADDFKEPPRAAAEPAKPALRTVDTESNEQIRDMIEEKLTAATSVAELEAISKRLRPEFFRLPDAMREAIGQVYDFKQQALLAFSEERAA